MQEGSRKAIVAALLANAGIAVAKFVGFAFTGAASMLAEGVHSVADSSNQGLLLLGGSRARRAASAEHPFGYGRERYFWSFVVALVLFTLGSLFALYEGIKKLRHPHELESAAWAVVILVIAIVFESFSMRTAIHESARAKGDQSWWSFVRHSKTPELPVVLLEDLGALVGLVLALAGVGLAELTGNPRFDAVGSVAIGLLLGVIAVTLVVEMKSLLIGESASPADLERIRRTLESSDGVQRVVHIRTQHLGPDELLVGAKLEFDGGIEFDALCAAVDRVEQSVRDAVPSARVIYLEPAIARP
ncbi:MAG TPA: cation diffusion facilitator family transporter [Acidimicrobiales bacterium]|nr:cation diffusion facilitator family transporter [Acidimicrobiales bacterium]